jgi:hypothetical protein
MAHIIGSADPGFSEKLNPGRQLSRKLILLGKKVLLLP